VYKGEETLAGAVVGPERCVPTLNGPRPFSGPRLLAFSLALPRRLVLGANPRGPIHIAADDFAKVRVNRLFAAGAGSCMDGLLATPAKSGPTTVDFGPCPLEKSNMINNIWQN
jgi:hypothetical protein